MGNTIDQRFLADGGQQAMTSTELVVKGLLECDGGVHLISGYPAEPLAEAFDVLRSLRPVLESHGVVARPAASEELAAAMVRGARRAGCRAAAVFGAVGLQHAVEAISAATEPAGGAGLYVVGQEEATRSDASPDSRVLAEHLNLPLIEPSRPQELKDWIDLGLKLSQQCDLPVKMLVAATVAGGGGTVTCRPNRYPTLNDQQKRSLTSLDGGPEASRGKVGANPADHSIERRLERAKQTARELGINQTMDRPQKGEVVPLGLIACGAAHAALAHALDQMGLTGRLPILKLGMTWPLDEEMVIAFARQVRQIVVVEEGRSFVEPRVLSALEPVRHRGSITVETFGRTLPHGLAGVPDHRTLHPSVLIERLVPLIRHHPTLPIELTNGRLDALLQRIAETAESNAAVPARTPTFCAGCPHRDSASVLSELRRDLADTHYMLAKHNAKPVGLAFHGDAGCSSLLQYEPTRDLMEGYSGAGLGGASSSGAAPFLSDKQVVVMGDGTFFQRGRAAISQSIARLDDVAYIILDNKTSAMRGQRGHLGCETDAVGQPLNAVEIEKAIEGLIPKRVKRDVRLVRINPADRKRYRNLLERMVLTEGVKIVIADKECAIARHRRADDAERETVERVGYLPRQKFMNVATKVCEYCLECTRRTGCPGLDVVPTDYGPKIQTSLSTCVNDRACQRIAACPSFEQIEVTRKSPARRSDSDLMLSQIPDPTPPIHADQRSWHCGIAGVGGMGVSLLTQVLCDAGQRMGYRVSMHRSRAKAIRTGSVATRVVFSRHRADGDQAAGMSRRFGPTALVPHGEADLLLGLDPMEAARLVDPAAGYRLASTDRTVAVVNETDHLTTTQLIGQEANHPAMWRQLIRDHVRPGGMFGLELDLICHKVLTRPGR